MKLFLKFLYLLFCCGGFCYLILRTRDDFSSLVSHSLCQWSWAPQHLPSFYISVLHFNSEYLKWWNCRYPNASFPILKFYYVKLSKGPSGQSYGSTSSRVWMWELDDKENWAPKNWCFWTVVLEKTLECPLDCQEIQPVHYKGDQSWVFIGRTDVEAETPILWPPHAKSWLIWKDPDAWKDWRREEKGTAEDEMVGWHHRLNGRVFE